MAVHSQGQRLQQWPQLGGPGRWRKGVCSGQGERPSPNTRGTSSLAAHILERCSTCPLVLIPSCTFNGRGHTQKGALKILLKMSHAEEPHGIKA